MASYAAAPGMPPSARPPVSSVRWPPYAAPPCAPGGAIAAGPIDSPPWASGPVILTRGSGEISLVGVAFHPWRWYAPRCVSPGAPGGPTGIPGSNGVPGVMLPGGWLDTPPCARPWVGYAPGGVIPACCSSYLPGPGGAPVGYPAGGGGGRHVVASGRRMQNCSPVRRSDAAELRDWSSLDGGRSQEGLGGLRQGLGDLVGAIRGDLWAHRHVVGMICEDDHHASAHLDSPACLGVDSASKTTTLRQCPWVLQGKVSAARWPCSSRESPPILDKQLQLNIRLGTYPRVPRNQRLIGAKVPPERGRFRLRCADGAVLMVSTGPPVRYPQRTKLLPITDSTLTLLFSRQNQR